MKYRKKYIPIPIPDDIEEMKSLLKKALKDIDTLKNEVENLKKNESIQKRKRISDVLNERNCNIYINDWIGQITITRQDIDVVLKNNLIIGIKHIFENLCTNKMEIPIAAFTQKQNRIYIYDTKWRMGTRKDIITHILDNIRSKLILMFNEWPEEEHRVYGKPGYELFGILYGSRYKDVDIANEIAKYLFNVLKINLEHGTVDDLEE
jgi:hypothetical protein